MALAIQIPGIPPLLSPNLRFVAQAGALLFADEIGNLQLTRPWGIYDNNGNKILDPDTVMSVGYRNNWKVSDYPVEQGAFASYNKVSTPFAATVTMIKGGNLSDRTAFLEAVDSISNSLTPNSIVTPEKTYLNAIVERYDFERRRESGANMIIVNLHLIEVRITASVQYASTRDGKQIDSSVPAGAKTNPTTSTGLPDPTAVKNPASSQVVNQGQVSPSSSNIDAGAIQ